MLGNKGQRTKGKGIHEQKKRGTSAYKNKFSEQTELSFCWSELVLIPERLGLHILIHLEVVYINITVFATENLKKCMLLQTTNLQLSFPKQIKLES